jgi:hypothetical protein
MLKFKEFSLNEELLIEAGKSSGYSDEHAFVNVWNHSVDKGHAQSREKMHAEINKAKTDPNHPLNFHKINSAGFKGGKKENSSPEKYYKELHHAADTIHDVANHKDFHDSVKNKEHASVAGGSRGVVANSWKKHGATNATSKADIKIGHHGISYKKSGGSQLMSGESAETKATYHHAAAALHHAGHIDAAQHAIITQHADKAAYHLAAMKDSTSDAEKRVHRDAAQAHINAAHKVHPKLNNFVHHEAASGHAKFSGGEGSASYIVTSYNEKTGSASIHHVNDYKKSKPQDLASPRAAAPKGRGRPGNLKIDIK